MFLSVRGIRHKRKCKENIFVNHATVMNEYLGLLFLQRNINHENKSIFANI